MEIGDWGLGRGPGGRWGGGRGGRVWEWRGTPEARHPAFCRAAEVIEREIGLRYDKRAAPLQLAALPVKPVIV